MNTFFTKATHFIKFNNGALVIAGLVFFAGTTAFAANPEVQQTVIGTETTETLGIDNAAIIDADLLSFTVDLRIEKVSESDENYIVVYSYRTIMLVEHAWQDTRKEGVLVVSKTDAGGDIKAYATVQLREVAKNEIGYLVRVQAAEQVIGRQSVAVVKEYSGLTGLAISLKDALLPPKIVPPTEAEVVQREASVPADVEGVKSATVQESDTGTNTSSQASQEPIQGITPVSQEVPPPDTSGVENTASTTSSDSANVVPEAAPAASSAPTETH